MVNSLTPQRFCDPLRKRQYFVYDSILFVPTILSSSLYFSNSFPIHRFFFSPQKRLICKRPVNDLSFGGDAEKRKTGGDILENTPACAYQFITALF